MITRDLLRALRNDLPMEFAIRQLGRDAPYSKYSDGRFRFVCFNCGELEAAVNPRNNLAHCFCCGKNINNIDLLVASGRTFRTAVQILEEWLRIYKNSENEREPKTISDPPGPIGKPNKTAERIGRILREAFEKDAQDSA